MPFTVNIFDNKFTKAHQNPLFNSKMLLENNQLNTERQSKTPFRMPLSSTRKTIVCGPCKTNVKVTKSIDLEEDCIKLCYKGNAVIKRSKDGIITNSNFRFTSMEVLDRNNKSFKQNEFNYTRPIKAETFYSETYADPDLIGLKSGEIYTNDYLINNSTKKNLIQKVGGNLNELIETHIGYGELMDPGNNGGLKCGISTYKFSNPKFTANGGVSAKNLINLLKYNNNFISQLNNCNNGEDCNIYQTMNYKDVDNENFCFPRRLNGKKQTCPILETYEIQETITIEGMDLNELKNKKGKIINMFLQNLNLNIKQDDFLIEILDNKFRIRALKQSIISFKFITQDIMSSRGELQKFNAVKILEAMNTIPGFTIRKVNINSITDTRIDSTKIKNIKKTLTPIFKPNQITSFNTLHFTIKAQTLIDTNVYVYINNNLYGDILNGSSNLLINFKLNEIMMNTTFDIRISQKKNGLLMSYMSQNLRITLDSKVSIPINFKVESSSPLIKSNSEGDDDQLSNIGEERDETKSKIHNTLFLTWDKCLDRDISGYEIYKDEKPFLIITDPNNISYIDTDLVQNQEYTYTIYNIDNLDNKSLPFSVKAISPDFKPPEIPKNLKATVLDSSIQLNWDEIPNIDKDFQKYHIYKDNQRIDEISDITNTTYVSTKLTNYTNYIFNITSIDGYGNESKKSNSVNIQPIDLTPPTDINKDDITIVEGNKSIIFKWAYDPDVSSFKIYEDFGEKVVDNSLNLLDHWIINNKDENNGYIERTLKNLINWKKYKFVIKSIDKNGNMSSGVIPNTEKNIYDISDPIEIMPNLIINNNNLSLPTNYTLTFDLLLPQKNLKKLNIMFFTNNINFDENLFLYNDWNNNVAWDKFINLVVEKTDAELIEDNTNKGIVGIKRRYPEDQINDGKDSDTLVVLPTSPAYNFLNFTGSYNESLTKPLYFINTGADWNKLSYNVMFSQIQVWGKYIFNNNANGLFYRKIDETFDWIKLGSGVKDFSVSKDTYDLSQNEFCIFTINNSDTIDVIDFIDKDRITTTLKFNIQSKKITFLGPHLLIIAGDNNIKYSRREKNPTWTTLGCCYFTDVKISEFGGKIIIIGHNTVASYYWKYTNDILNGTWELIQDTEGLIDDKTKYLNLSIGTYLYLYNDNDELKKTLKMIGGGSISGNIYLEGDNLMGEGSLKWDDNEGKLYYNKTSFDRIIDNKIYRLKTTGIPYRTLNQQQCQDYATTTAGKTFHSVNFWDTKPPGCAEHPPTGRVFFNTQGDDNLCNEGGHACVELNEGFERYRKIDGTPDMSLTEEECKKYASDNNKGFLKLTNPTGNFKGCIDIPNDRIYFADQAEFEKCQKDRICIQKRVLPRKIEFYEKTSGTPDGNMTEQECYAEAARQGITNASAWDWNGWPNGCMKPEADQFRWNTTGTVDCGTSGVPCIQKRVVEKNAEWIEYKQTFNKLIDNHYIKTKEISGEKNILGKFKKISLEKNHIWGIDNNDNLNYSIIKIDNNNFNFGFIKIEGKNVTDLSVTDNGMCVYSVINNELYRKMEDDEGNPSWKYLYKSSFFNNDFPIDNFLRELLNNTVYGEAALMVNITENQNIEVITQTMENKFIKLQSDKKIPIDEFKASNIKIQICGDDFNLFYDNDIIIQKKIDFYRSTLDNISLYISSKNSEKFPVFTVKNGVTIKDTTQTGVDENGNEQIFTALNPIDVDDTTAVQVTLEDTSDDKTTAKINKITINKIYSPMDNVAPIPPDLSGIPQNYQIKLLWDKNVTDNDIKYYKLYKNDILLKKYALQDKVIFNYNRKLNTNIENYYIKKDFVFPYNYEFKYSITLNKTQMKGSCLFRIANVDKDVAVGARFISNFFSSGKNRIEINTGVIPKEGESMYWTNVQQMVPISLNIKYDITITFRENSRKIVVVNTSSNEITTYNWSAGNRIRGTNEDRKNCYFMLSDTRFWGRKKSDFILEDVSLKEIKYSEDLNDNNMGFIDDYVDARQSYVYSIDVEDTLNISNKKSITLKPLDQRPPKKITITIVVGDRNIKLNWEDTTEKDIKEFIIYRRHQMADGINWSMWKQIGSHSITLGSMYEDTTIINGQIYQYNVTISDFNGNISDKSNIVEGKGSREPEIINFNIKSGNQQAILSWDKSISGIFKSYVIDRTPVTNADNHDTLVKTTTKLDFPITIKNENVIKYVDYSLKNDIEYTYSIFEVGEDGRKSSIQVKQMIPKKNLNNDFGNSFNFNRVETGLNKMTIYWPPNKSTFFQQYRIYINRVDKQALYIPTFLPTEIKGETRYTFRNLINNKKYSIQLIALDNQQRIIDCYLFNGTPIDNPPSVPKNITVTPASNQIKLEWTKNTEEDVVGYMIYRDNNIISTIKHPTNNYTDKNVVLGKSYIYNIISYDVGGNSSIKSSDIVTRPEIVPGAPLKISNFKINSSKNKLTLEFGKNNESDIKYYNIYRKKGTTRSDKIYARVEKNGNKYFQKQIIDYSKHSHSNLKRGGNISNRPEPAFWKGNINDTGWLGEITDGMPTINKNNTVYNSHWIQLDLSGSKDVVGINMQQHDEIRYATKIALKGSNKPDNWEKEDWVEITPKKTEKNFGEPVVKDKITTLLFPEYITCKYLRIYILSFNEEPGIRVELLYNCLKNNNIIFVDNNLINSQNYEYRITAEDIYAQESIVSNSIISQPIDPFPGAPTIPLNLSSSYGNSKVILSWTKNKQGDIWKYYIYKKIGTNTFILSDKVNDESSNYSIKNDIITIIDNNVTNGTEYTYKITAVDTDKLESSQSTVTVVTPNDDPPKTPGNFKLYKHNKKIRMSWDKNTEEDFKQYNVYKGLGVDQVHAFTVTDANSITIDNSIYFNDTNVVNGNNYFYQIKAVDNAHQESIATALLNIIPEDLPPTPPSIDSIEKCDEYLKLKLKLNLIDTDIVKYKLNRDNITVQTFINNTYISVLPKSHYAISSFETDGAFVYDDPRLDQFGDNYLGWKPNISTNSYIELTIPDADKDNIIVGLAIKGFDIDNYPKKFKIFTSKTYSVTTTNSEIMNDNKDFVEGEFTNAGITRVLFKNPKSDIKKIKILSLDWKGSFAMKCGVIFGFGFLNQYHYYSDYNLINDRLYNYEFIAEDESANVATSIPLSGKPYDCFPPESVNITNIVNLYKSLIINWETSNDKNLKHYTLYKNGKKLLNTTDNQYTDNDIQNKINYKYEISVTDDKDNESGKSSIKSGKSVLPILQNLRLINKTHDSITIESNSLQSLNDIVTYKAYLKKKGEDYQNPIENVSSRIIISNLDGDVEYGVKMSSLVDGIESPLTTELLIKTDKTPTNNLTKVNNFLYDISVNTIPRRIKLFWDFNTTDWDLKGYYITIKKGTGIIAISNMKNVFLLKDKNEYIINNFDWNTLYEIKIYSQSNTDLLSPPSILQFTSNKDPDVLLKENTQNIIDKIANNISEFNIGQLEELKKEVDSFSSPHTDLQTEFDEAKALIIPRITSLKNDDNTQEQIDKIIIELNSIDNLSKLKKLDLELNTFTPSSGRKTDYETKKVELETRINNIEWNNKTLKYIQEMDLLINEADTSKNIDNMEKNKQKFIEYNPYSDLVVTYDETESIFLNKLEEIKNYNIKKTETINKTNLLKNSINDTLSNITAVLNNISLFVPLQDNIYLPKYNIAKLDLENKKAAIIAFETEKFKWMALPIKDRTIHKQLTSNWLEWSKDNNDLIINVLGVDNDIYFQFNLLELETYIGGMMIRPNDEIILKINIVRLNNNAYETFKENIQIKIYADKLKNKGSGYGKIHKDANLGTNTPNIFKVGDLLTIGNSWKTNNIFEKIYTLDDVNIGKYQWGGDTAVPIVKKINNSYIDYTFTKDGNINLDSKYYNNYSNLEVIKIFNTAEKTLITNGDTINDTGYANVLEIDIGMGWKTKILDLNNYSLRVPSQDTEFSTGIVQNTKPSINSRSISFWVKNWNSAKLFYTNNGDLVNAITKDNINSSIVKFIDEKGNKYKTTVGSSTALNIWGLNVWKFVYSEFKQNYIFTSNADNYAYFNYNDGDISLCNVQFYKSALSLEQLEVIHKNDITYYSIWKKVNGTPNKIFTLNFSNKFFINNINPNDGWYISRKKRKYSLNDSDKNKFSYKEWTQEYGKFNKKITNTDDIITINGFDNANEAKNAAELYPTCIGVSRFDNKYFLMENTSTYDNKEDWVNKLDGEFFVSQENWRGNRTVKRLSWKYNILNNTQKGWEKMIKLASKNDTFIKEYISNDVYNSILNTFPNFKKNQSSYFIFPLTNTGIYGKLKNRGIQEIQITDWPSLGSNYKTIMNTSQGSKYKTERNTVLISSGATGLKEKWTEQINNEVFKNKLVFFKYFYQYDEIPDSFYVGILFNYTYMLSNFPHDNIIADLST